MQMLKRRGTHESENGTATTTRTRTDGQAYTAPAPSATGERTWHRGPARALMTLLGVGVAGLLAWLTTTFSDASTGGYWAALGILAGAGLVLALSQLLGGWTKWGRPSFSLSVFLLAFVPTLVAAGWILLFHQPHSTLFRGHITDWSNSIGIDAFVKDMGGNLLTVLALGLGLVFGFCFDTTRARRPVAPGREAPVQRTAPVTDTDADQPIAREREAVRS
jgi:hypothetical protein